MAGVPSARLEAALGGEPVVVRAMPNTPALVGAGVTAISGGSFATSRDLAWAEDVLSAVGTVVRLPERLQDAVTGLSGSGPAYFFLVAEALIEAGVQMGLARDVSRTLVVETMQGSATLLQETGRDPEALARHGHFARRHHCRRGSGPSRPGRCVPRSWRRWPPPPNDPATCSAERPAMTREAPAVPFSSSPTSAPRTSSPAWCTRHRRACPGTTVIDLTHHVPPFDAGSGSHTLVRAVPHLGPGVVLAVVDPGVGTVASRHRTRGRPCPPVRPWAFVGPDNGLLVAAAEAAAEARVTRVVELTRPPPPPDRGSTFDGRVFFAPAAADLCAGVALEQAGWEPIAPGRRWCA